MKRGNFAQAVLAGRVQYPNHPSFSLANWEEAYAKTRSTKGDELLFQSGIWLFERFQEIHNSISSSEAFQVGREQAIKLFCAIANYHLYGIRGEIKGVEGFNLAKHISPQIQVKSGGKFSADELISTVIDGVKFPIFYAINSLGSANQQKNNQNLFAACLDQFNMGIAYSLLIDIWFDCLAGRLFVDESDPSCDVVKPLSDQNEIRYCISTFLRENTDAQHIFYLMSSWKYLDARSRRGLFSSRIVTGFEKQGKKLRPLIGYFDYQNSSAPSAWVTTEMARTGYYDGLLDQEFPKQPDLTGALLIRVWELLSSMAEQLSKRRSGRDIRTVNDLYEYVSAIPRLECVNLVMRGLGCERKVAIAAIDFLTYKGLKGQDLWSQPLVECNRSDLSFMFLPLVLGNLLRVVERWLRQGGVDLSSKGSQFEHHVRKEVQTYFLASQIRQSVCVSKSGAYVSTEKGVREEIDLVVSIGNAVLVVEVKCLLAPADSIEYLRYFDALESAAEQISRKAAVAQQHIAQVFECLGMHRHQIPSQPFVVSAVLTSSPVGVGFTANGVPVIDLRTLFTFSQGYYSVWSIIEAGKTVKEDKVLLYKSLDEAVNNLSSYLQEPPSISNTKRFLAARSIPLPARKRDNKPARMDVFQIDVERFEKLEHNNLQV